MGDFANTKRLGVAEQKDLSCNATVGGERLGSFDCVSARSDGVFPLWKFLHSCLCFDKRAVVF